MVDFLTDKPDKVYCGKSCRPCYENWIKNAWLFTKLK